MTTVNKDIIRRISVEIFNEFINGNQHVVDQRDMFEKHLKQLIADTNCNIRQYALALGYCMTEASGTPTKEEMEIAISIATENAIDIMLKTVKHKLSEEGFMPFLQVGQAIERDA